MGTELPRIFERIDADFAGFNIQDYIIRVSTLEEVFIEIGRREDEKITKELELNQSYEGEILGGAPLVESVSFCARLMALLKSSFQSYFNGGLFFLAMVVGFVFIIALIITIYLPIHINYPPVTLNQVQKIFPDTAPLKLVYN